MGLTAQAGGETPHLGKAIEAVEKPKAQERQISQLKQGEEQPRAGNFPEREKGETRDRVGEAVGKRDPLHEEFLNATPCRASCAGHIKRRRRPEVSMSSRGREQENRLWGILVRFGFSRLGSKTAKCERDEQDARGGFAGGIR